MKKAIEANPSLKPYNIRYSGAAPRQGMWTTEQQQGIKYYDQINKKISEALPDVEEFSRLKSLRERLVRLSDNGQLNDVKRIDGEIENLIKNNLKLKLANSH